MQSYNDNHKGYGVEMKIIFNTRNIGLLLIMLVFLSGCGMTLPPITKTPTNVFQFGKFVWVDLITDDVKTVKKFYADIFAWEYEDLGGGYTLVSHHGNPVCGILESRRVKEDIRATGWLSYLSVQDVDAAANYIRENGGTILREPWDFDDRGRMSVVKDPQGTVFILLTATGGDPDDILPRLGQWLWSEFITVDAPGAITFYEKLMNYNVEKQELTEGREYLVLKYKHKYRAGIVQTKRQDIKPTWLPYIRVEDPGPVVKRTKQLGGKVLLEPTQDIRKGSVAVIEDPTGGIIAVQKWPIE